MFSRTAWKILALGALTVTIAMGVRQTLGIFLVPVSMDLGIGRAEFGFAIALQQLLFGLAQPFVGAIADHHGAGRVIAAGALLYAAAMALAAFAGDSVELTITLGVMLGVALSATTYVVVLGVLGRAVAPAQRSLAFGISTAAGSFGMFAAVPGAQGLLSVMDWRSAFLVMASAVGVIAVLSIGLAGRPAAASAAEAKQSLGEALREAGRHSGFWLLTAGFFVCGFHVAFIATHLPAFLADHAIDPSTSALALAMIGLFNIFGSYLAGLFGGWYRKKYLLTGIYLARALVIAMFLVVPLSGASAVVFGAAIGFLWLSTVPLTSGLVGQIFGMRYLSMLYGIVFLSHQVGAFLGAWLGGLAYDWTGSYDAVWIASIALAVLAGLVNWPIADRPVARLQPQPA